MYEHCAKIDKNGDSAGNKKSEEASGKKNEGDSSSKPSLNFTETFKLHLTLYLAWTTKVTRPAVLHDDVISTDFHV